MPILSATDLTKEFERPKKNPGLRGALKHLVRPQFTTVRAVNAISFAVEPGESVAYVGPNGAGKSTTVKLLTGILVPTSGDVQVCGLVPAQQRVANARNISVVFGQRTQLWWDIPVIESLRLLGDIYEVPEADYRRTLDELVDTLDLGDLLAVPARQLSLGQRMRCDLAAALVHSPRVLFLDEPTIGLDVAVKVRFREFVARMHTERGLTVMLTSHDLGDIEQLCERMIMIDAGSIVYDGPFADVTTRFGWEKRIHVTLPEPEPDASARATSALERVGATVEAPEPTGLEVIFDGRRATTGEVISALAAAVPITDLAIEEQSAESIIRQLYEGRLNFEDEQ